MTLLDFIALILAAGCLVDVWRNGSILATWRSEAEAYRSFGDSAPWWARLLNCDYCLSFHVTWLPAALTFVPALFVPDPWAQLLRLPLYTLAAIRGSILLNFLLPADARYSRGLLAMQDWEERDG